jgi:carbohydrate diacid regulator
MILEQAQLAGELPRDSRYREAFVLNLINGDHANQADLTAWAHRLGVQFDRMHAVYLLELDERATARRLHALQLRLQARLPALLTAAAGERELAILDFFEAPGPGHHKQLQALAGVLRELCPQPPADDGHRHKVDGVATSWHSARTAARIGRQRHPRKHQYSYYDHALPVLLSGLNTGWQAAQLRAPIEKLGKNRVAAAHAGCLVRADGHPPPPPTRCTSTATRWTTACAASAKSQAWTWGGWKTASCCTSVAASYRNTDTS